MVPSIFSENIFDNFFGDDFFGEHSPLYGKHGKNLMKTDIHEKDGGYELAIDLPGFKKDEISLDIKDGYLSISAQKGLDKDEGDKKGRIIRQERYAGVCSRSFYVGDVKPEDVKAKYESGVLTITLPKDEPKKLENKSRITIE
ncbi:MAG: Hsp20/alpha crystallin family protein [Clostridiales bacterium]|nr:Hsp20/alpha crystallin family protein [Clostridiales bacterium]